MSGEYQRGCFQRPCLELLPVSIQQLLTGELTTRSGEVIDAAPKLPEPKCEQRTDTTSDPQPPVSKVDDMLEQIRGVEGSLIKLSEPPQMIMKVMNEKITDITLDVMGRTTGRIGL